MKKFYGFLGFFAAFSMSVFASKTQELKPKDFEDARKAVLAIKAAYDAGALNEWHFEATKRLGAFYGSSDVVAAYSQGGIQEHCAERDISEIVALAECVNEYNRVGRECVEKAGIPTFYRLKPVRQMTKAEMIALGLPPRNMAPEGDSMGRLQ